MSEPMTLADAVDALLAAADAAYTSHVGGVTYVPVQAIEELRSAQRASLDVERLERVLERIWRAKWETEPGKGTVVLFGAYAADIAREYAADR
jgi:hypothetical protein